MKLNGAVGERISLSDQTNESAHIQGIRSVCSPPSMMEAAALCAMKDACLVGAAVDAAALRIISSKQEHRLCQTRFTPACARTLPRPLKSALIYQSSHYWCSKAPVETQPLYTNPRTQWKKGKWSQSYSRTHRKQVFLQATTACLPHANTYATWLFCHMWHRECQSSRKFCLPPKSPPTGPALLPISSSTSLRRHYRAAYPLIPLPPRACATRWSRWIMHDSTLCKRRARPRFV